MKLKRRIPGFSFFGSAFFLFAIVFRLGFASAAELPLWADFFATTELGSPLDSALIDVPARDPEEAEFTEDAVGLKAFFRDSLIVYFGSWPFVLAFDQTTREGVFHSSFSQWHDNVAKAPVWNDGSGWVTNNVGHGFLGATYFLYYRSQGHGLLASSLGVALQTVLFEYTIEGWHVRPSAQDLVKTPGIGIPLGFAMDELSIYFLKKTEKPLRYLGYFFNPFNLLPWSKDRWHATVDPLNRNLAFSIRF